jgi:hypothetical protein
MYPNSFLATSHFRFRAGKVAEKSQIFSGVSRPPSMVVLTFPTRGVNLFAHGFWGMKRHQPSPKEFQ